MCVISGLYLRKLYVQFALLKIKGFFVVLKNVSFTFKLAFNLKEEINISPEGLTLNLWPLECKNMSNTVFIYTF